MISEPDRLSHFLKNGQLRLSCTKGEDDSDPIRERLPSVIELVLDVFKVSAWCFSHGMPSGPLSVLRVRADGDCCGHKSRTSTVP